MILGPSWGRLNDSRVTRKVTRTSGIPGRLDMRTDTLSRCLASADGNTEIASSALGVEIVVYDKRTRAFENFQCPESLDRTNVPLKRGE
jgi:hypothetical protein